MKKIGIYSPYYGVMGGGELYLGTIAEVLSRDYQVELISESPVQVSLFQKYFGLNVEKIRVRQVPQIPFVESLNPLFLPRLIRYYRRTAFTGEYDLFVIMPRNFRIPFRILSRRKILHLQVPDRPWNATDLFRALTKGNWNLFRNEIVKHIWYPVRYSRFDAVLINSVFHRDIISGRLRNPNAVVLPPPVSLKRAVSWALKEKLILSVGRFFSGLHHKRHDVLIRAFRDISNRASGWKLALAGGLADDPGSNEYYDGLQKLAEGLPVEFYPNVPFQQLNELYSRASYYWHAAGYGSPPDSPEQQEHFGISTVEAMSAGCIPIVFCGGGLLEIVQEKHNGFFWKQEDELAGLTLQAIEQRDLLEGMSASAIERSREFSRERFVETIRSVTKKLLDDNSIN